MPSPGGLLLTCLYIPFMSLALSCVTAGADPVRCVLSFQCAQLGTGCQLGEDMVPYDPTYREGVDVWRSVWMYMTPVAAAPVGCGGEERQ